MERKQVPVSSVEGINTADGIVEAIVSVTNVVDSVNDIIEPGAYARTLKKRTPKGVWSHDTNIPVAKTLSVVELLPKDPRLPADLLAQNAGALLVKMQFNMNTTRGRDAFYDVQFYGPEQEYSIGYSVGEGNYRIDEKSGIRYIKSLELYEYSPVIFGAAPNTRTLSIKEDEISFAEEKDDLPETETFIIAEQEEKAAYSDIDFSIPAGVKKQAEIGLEWSKEFNRGGTSVGKNTANYLINNSTVSPQKARHIARYFPRHEVDLSTPANSKPGADGYPGAGLIAWKLWGGDEGRRWSQKLVDAMNRRDGVKAATSSFKVGDFVFWRASGGRAFGKIEKIVRDGEINVPNSSFTITGTPDDPAALIRIYRVEGINSVPTEVRVGHKFSTLEKVDGEKDIYTDMPEGNPSSFGTPQRITTPTPPGFPQEGTGRRRAGRRRRRTGQTMGYAPTEGKPYRVSRNGGGCNGYAVIKEGESSPVPGGCHETLADARRHMSALYTAEAGAKMASMGVKADEEINGCPAATQDISVNLRNRAVAVSVANYGPMNPELPNDEFWKAKGDLFNTTPEIAKQSRCSNCAAFIQTTKMLNCIEKGLDSGPEAVAIVEKANLGYCEIFDFKCAGERTCDAWVTGGPVTDADIKESDIEEFKDAGAMGRGVPTHHTQVNMNRAWDKTQPYKNMKSPATSSYYDRIFAYQNPNTKGDRKTHYNFIHHYVGSDGTPGEASYSALINSMSVLNGGRSGTTLRGEARRAVYNHIAAHYRDAGKEPPELKSDEYVDYVMIMKGLLDKPLTDANDVEVKGMGGPIPSHTTPVSDGRQLTRENAILVVKSPADRAYYSKVFAYQLPNTDGTKKTHYTFIHHFVSADGKPGAAAMSELKVQMSVLNGARSGTILRGAERKAVWNHLAHHYRDFGATPPELKSDQYLDNIMMQKGLITEPLSNMEDTND